MKKPTLSEIENNGWKGFPTSLDRIKDPVYAAWLNNLKLIEAEKERVKKKKQK